MSVDTEDWADHMTNDDVEDQDNDKEEDDQARVCGDLFFRGAVPIISGAESFLSTTTSQVNERNTLTDLALKKTSRAALISKQQDVVHRLVLQNTITDAVSHLVVAKNRTRQLLADSLKKTSIDDVHDKILTLHQSRVVSIERKHVEFLHMFKHLHKERPEEYAITSAMQKIFDKEEETSDRRSSRGQAEIVVAQLAHLQTLQRDLKGFFRVLGIEDTPQGYEEAVKAAVLPELPAVAKAVISGPIQLQKRDDWLFRSLEEMGPIDVLESASDCTCDLCSCSVHLGRNTNKRKAEKDVTASTASSSREKLQK